MVAQNSFQIGNGTLPIYGPHTSGLPKQPLNIMQNTLGDCTTPAMQMLLSLGKLLGTALSKPLLLEGVAGPKKSRKVCIFGV